MFNKLRYAYHLTACEKMIKKGTYIDYSTYEPTKRYKWHKRKLNKIVARIYNKRK